MRDAFAEHADFTRTVRLHLDAQQPALDAAVPDSVRAIGAQPKLLTQFRRTGEHRGIPALEALAQHAAELTVHQARALVVLQTHTVGRIGAQQTRQRGLPARQRCRIGKGPGDEADQLIHARTHGIFARAADRECIAVLSAHDDGRGLRARARARLSLLTQARPQWRVVAAPAEKPEILPRQSGSTVGSEQGCFYAEGARAAQWIEEFGAVRGKL